MEECRRCGLASCFFIFFFAIVFFFERSRPDRIPFRQGDVNRFRKIAGFKDSEDDTRNKTESIISNPYSAVVFNKIHYYWDRKYYQAVSREHEETVCVEEIQPNDSSFSDVRFEDGTRLEEIVYGCPRSHSCCDFDCCLERSGESSLDLATLLVALVLVTILATLIFCAMVMGSRSRRKYRRARTTANAQPDIDDLPNQQGNETLGESSRTGVPSPAARHPIPVFIPIEPVPRVNSKNRILPPPMYDDLEASDIDRPPSYEDVPRQ